LYCSVLRTVQGHTDSSRDQTDPMEAIASHEMQAGLCAGRGGLGGENTNFHEKVDMGGLLSISGRRDRLLTTRIKAAVLLLLAIMSGRDKMIA